jgi:hypothetical protein
MAAHAAAATRLLLRHFPATHAAVLAQLAPTPELQFAYLRALLSQRSEASGGSGGGGSGLRALLREGG